MPGVLYVVATPLGNLQDLTERARTALAAADLVAAEDTRRTGQLLSWLGLRKPQVACHKFSEARTVAPLLAALAEGRAVALVTDGGTPAVSDPGHRLVAAAHAAGHRVVPVPGPSAVVAALCASGLPADRFHFAGFLPARAAERRRELARLAALPVTLVLFEAPHRLKAALDECVAVLGDRPATLCRELTKLYEEVRPGTLASLRDEIAARREVLGEIALVIAGAGAGAGKRPPGTAAVADDPELARSWSLALAEEENDPRRALRRLARELGLDRAELKRRLQAAGLGR